MLTASDRVTHHPLLLRSTPRRIQYANSESSSEEEFAPPKSCALCHVNIRSSRRKRCCWWEIVDTPWDMGVDWVAWVVWCLQRADRDNNFDTEIIDSCYFDWVGYKTITPRSFICLFMKCFARIEFAGKKIIIGVPRKLWLTVGWLSADLLRLFYQISEVIHVYICFVVCVLHTEINFQNNENSSLFFVWGWISESVNLRAGNIVSQKTPNSANLTVEQIVGTDFLQVCCRQKDDTIRIVSIFIVVIWQLISIL